MGFLNNNRQPKKPIQAVNSASTWLRITCMVMVLLTMLAAMTGCSSLNPSEQTLEKQLRGLQEKEQDDLPVLMDVYGSQVEKDIYDKSEFKLP